MEYITLEKKDHPTPEEIEENHIIFLVRSELLDLWKPLKTIPCKVLDPFGGACTVPLVCEKYYRKWVACELSEEYCNISKARVEDYVNGCEFNTKIKSNDNKNSDKVDPLFSLT